MTQKTLYLKSFHINLQEIQMAQSEAQLRDVLVKAEKPLIFLRVIGNMPMKKVFPNSAIILLTLETILVR